LIFVVVVVVVDDLLDVDLDLLKIAPCTPHLKAEFLTWIFFPFRLPIVGNVVELNVKPYQTCCGCKVLYVLLDLHPQR